MNEIRLVGDHYAVLRDGVVLGTVERTTDGHWGWFPVWGGEGQYAHLLLHEALEEAYKAEAPLVGGRLGEGR
jgi:hypothetical protein